MPSKPRPPRDFCAWCGRGGRADRFNGAGLCTRCEVRDELAHAAWLGYLAEAVEGDPCADRAAPPLPFTVARHGEAHASAWVRWQAGEAYQRAARRRAEAAQLAEAEAAARRPRRSGLWRAGR